MNEKLEEEAMELHRRLYQAMLDEDKKRDSYGHQIGNQTRIARLDRLAMLSADRWRRRMGYEFRRVPQGVRGSREVQS